ncbi:MAG TPA: DUF1080 domain-containing protein [bacterium]|nr:DUF1080 domain-containing protein [bacterium]
MRKVVLSTVILVIGQFASYACSGQELTLNFDKEDIGKAPTGWNIEATNARGEIASWKVMADLHNGQDTKVLGMTKANDDFGGTFNLCWIDSIQFKDGEIEVSFKALKGVVDQGGGPIWRVKDMNNYYIARANPLENNFRLYYVKDSSRKTLDSARVKVPANQWHVIKIVHTGEKIEGYLNGEKLLECIDDTFTEAGGIGLWTKADAVTNFDDIKLKHSK